MPEDNVGRLVEGLGIHLELTDSCTMTSALKMGSARIPRLVIARWAMETLPTMVTGAGVYEAGSLLRPAFWSLDVGGCKLVLTQSVLLLPVDPALSTLLDVWLDVGGKVLSISWFPEKPWIPPRVVALKSGDWLYRLGWKGS